MSEPEDSCEFDELETDEPLTSPMTHMLTGFEGPRVHMANKTAPYRHFIPLDN